jgi:hypothetical protein
VFMVRVSFGLLFVRTWTPILNSGTQVTGDHPKTAEAIARKINLITSETKKDVSIRTGR